MGFIKYDLLGLSTLRMIEGAIRHVLIREEGIEDPSFEDVRGYYNSKLHPDIIDFDDQKIYKNIFQKGKWAGIFQFTEKGAQNLCMQVKPTNIIDIAAITSIFRPGPLSANVDKDFMKTRKNANIVKYINDVHREVTEETNGFLIFQEQISMLAHKLGKDLSLDEANMLRKVLTKKGTGKAAKVKKALHGKFVQGCVDKGLDESVGQRLWETFEYFSGYGFNKSHAVSYSILSYQCAWLLNYYPECWMAAFLDKEPESRKEKAISITKNFKFEIAPVNINTSGRVWEISEDGKTLIQPLTSIKGLGDAAIDQVFLGRPYENVEEFLFNEKVRYSKLNKKTIDVLTRSGALTTLMDDRFTGLKHFWSAIAVDRPRKIKNLVENIEKYAPEGDFTEAEKIQFLVELTGQFPIHKVMNEQVMLNLSKACVPPISEYDPELEVVWLVPRKITRKKTKNGKDYLVVDVTDSNSSSIRVRCWGVDVNNGISIQVNKPYMIKPQYNLEWGFSTRGRTYKTWIAL